MASGKTWRWGGGVFSIISDLLTLANRGRPPTPPPGFSWCHQQISSILLKRRPKRQKRVLNFHSLTLVKEWKFKTKNSRKMHEIINECQKNEKIVKIVKKWSRFSLYMNEICERNWDRLENQLSCLWPFGLAVFRFRQYLHIETWSG